MKFYPNNPSHERAAVLLSTMTQGQVEAIVNLVAARGRSVISDISDVTTAIPRYNAILDEEYIENAGDLVDVAQGLGTLIIADFRKSGARSAEDYSNILQSAYSLPEGLADKVADKIETEDVIGSADDSVMDTLGNSIKTAVQDVLNWGAKVLQTGWYIDPTQKYDIDFLYEMKLLGEAVGKMNSRVGLMEGQAKLNESYGLFQTGDVDGPDGENMIENRVANVLGRMTLKKLPPKIMGDVMPLAKLGNSITNSQAIDTVNKAGLNKQSGTKPDSAVKRAVDNLLSGSAGKAALLGLASGGAIPLIGIIKDMLSKTSTGDVDYGDVNDLIGEPYSMIAEDYGDNAASAWLNGDVEGMIDAISQEADDSATSGDPDMDDAIEAEVAEEAGDIDTEIGGLFSRARANIQKRKAARRQRKAYRRTARQSRKMLKTKSRADRKFARRKRLEEARATNLNVDTQPIQQYDSFDPDSFGGAGYSDNLTDVGMAGADPSYLTAEPSTGYADDYYGGAYYY